MFEKIFKSDNVSSSENVKMAGGNGGNPNYEKDNEKVLEGGVLCEYCGKVIEEGKMEFHKNKLCINTKDNEKEFGDSVDDKVNDLL